MKKKFVVVGEHTLGYINSQLPDTVWILNSSILKGATSTWLDGSIPHDEKNTRPATRADFDTFRISPGSIKCYMEDPSMIFQ